MKGKEKENLINLALIYNCLVNKSDEIDIYLLWNYLHNINKILKEKKFGNIDVYGEIEDTASYRVSEDDYGKYIKLKEDGISLECLYHDTVHSLEDYFLNISLNESVLKTLNIKREDLPIESYFERKQDVIEIYSLSKHNAIGLTRKYLEMDGMKNIQISGAYPAQLEGDKGYQVYVNYDFVCEYLNIDKFKDYTNKTQESQEDCKKRLVKKWGNVTK